VGGAGEKRWHARNNTHNKEAPPGFQATQSQLLVYEEVDCRVWGAGVALGQGDEAGDEAGK